MTMDCCLIDLMSPQQNRTLQCACHWENKDQTHLRTVQCLGETRDLIAAPVMMVRNQNHASLFGIEYGTTTLENCLNTPSQT